MSALDGFGTRKADTLAGQNFADKERAATELAYSLLAAIETRRDAFNATGRTDWSQVEELAELNGKLQEVADFLNRK